MTDISDYTPPKVWQWQQDSAGTFSTVNRPTAGARFDNDLPRGKHSLQLYSMGTPNGVKVTILLEELLEQGLDQADYDAYMINILEGDQFSSGFVEINPNSKIPALIDYSLGEPVRIFESGAILLYLAEKFNSFMPEGAKRAECLSWLFWQVGSAPFLGGGFGHFYAYAPQKLEYPINRYAMEAKRQLDVLDKHLAGNQYLCANEYTIADMAIWPWYGELVRGKLYEAAEFLNVNSYQNVLRWANNIAARPAVQRGKIVNRTWGEPHEQLPERHSKQDFNR